LTSVTAFKRSQVEWALWRYFCFGSTDRPAPPAVFKTRIKRLLEIDRLKEKYEESEVPHARFAFIDGPPDGQGRDVPYTAFNAFCLALGLDLLDAGFKQSEIVFLLRHIRRKLEEEFSRILKNPPEPREALSAEQRPNCPSYEKDGHSWADCRVFMVLNKVELKEVFAVAGNESSNSQPIIFGPILCYGMEALITELQKMHFEYRKALVIELAHTAAMVSDLLKEAPLVKRGRK